MIARTGRNVTPTSAKGRDVLGGRRHGGSVPRAGGRQTPRSPRRPLDRVSASLRSRGAPRRSPERRMRRTSGATVRGSREKYGLAPVTRRPTGRASESFTFRRALERTGTAIPEVSSCSGSRAAGECDLAARPASSCSPETSPTSVPTSGTTTAGMPEARLRTSL
jgi:hypothetical protein